MSDVAVDTLDREPKHILIVDFPSRGPLHAAYNGSYLKMLRLAYPKAKITFFADPSHNKALKGETAGIGNLDWQARPDLYGNGKVLPAFKTNLQHLKALWRGAFISKRAIEAIAAQTPPDLVCLISPPPLVFGALRFAKLPKQTSLHYLAHGQLKDAKEDTRRNPIWKIFNFKNEVRFWAGRKATYMFLEKHIETSFRSYMNDERLSTFTLEHPLPDLDIPLDPKPLKPPVKVGFLGRATPAKGFLEFVEIANALHSDDLQFHVFGHLGNGMEDLDLSALAQKPTTEKIPQDVFIAGLMDLDCIVQPLSKTYTDNASGTLLDAVAYEKPLFCLDNSIIETLTQRFGDIGFIANDVPSLTQAIQDFAGGKFGDDLPKWRANQRALKKARSLDAIAHDYRTYFQTPGT